MGCSASRLPPSGLDRPNLPHVQEQAASGTGAATNKAEALRQVEANWRRLRGHELEPALESGAIALLDAGWLVASKERGETIRRRQDLPPEAFIPLEELKAACDEYVGLPIICLSYAWLHPDHPVSRPRLAATASPAPPAALTPLRAPAARRTPRARSWPSWRAPSRR